VLKNEAEARSVYTVSVKADMRQGLSKHNTSQDS
jgi:hypothetical protein